MAVIEGYDRVKARLKMHLVDMLDEMSVGERTRVERPWLEEHLRRIIVKRLPEEIRMPKLSPQDQDHLIDEAINEVVGYDVLDLLLADVTITEIMVNGPHEIFVERDGHLERIKAQFKETNHLMAVIERLLGKVNLTVNESSPLCDACLPDGSRMNVIIPPLVLNGPVVTIRKKHHKWTMDEYIATGMLSEQAAEFLEACVRAKINFVISGGTSTGKTTLCGILATFIPDEQRIISIESVSEFELAGKKHWVRLVAKPPNAENRGEIPLRTLLKNALRMRPDRIILGEARGGEAFDVVQAMHSGHDGFVTVLHANNPRAALERLETLMLLCGLDLPTTFCRIQIASVVDLVVHVERFVDGSRRVAAISQVMGVSQEGFVMEELFGFRAAGFSPEGELHGGCEYVGTKPKFLHKFQLNNVPIPSWLSA